MPGHCNLCDIPWKASLKCHWQYYWTSTCAFFFHAEASVWGEVDGGNGLAKAMAGEDGYVENQVLFIYLFAFKKTNSVMAEKGFEFC